MMQWRCVPGDGMGLQVEADAAPHHVVCWESSGMEGYFSRRSNRDVIRCCETSMQLCSSMHLSGHTPVQSSVLVGASAYMLTDTSAGVLSAT